jgi:hypothetical protein
MIFLPLSLRHGGMHPRRAVLQPHCYIPMHAEDWAEEPTPASFVTALCQYGRPPRRPMNKAVNNSW